MDTEKMPSSTTGTASAANEAAKEAVAEQLLGGNSTQAHEDNAANGRHEQHQPQGLQGLQGTNGRGGHNHPPAIETAPAPVGLLTLREIRREPRVRVYITKANEQMAIIGYTEHGHRHAGIVATIARSILHSLGLPERTGELAAIAGYLHDMGCVVNRQGHVEAGAIISLQILSSLGMDPVEIADIVGAIGNHEEPYGIPISAVAAAVIIADKSDVHYSRVQNPDSTNYDIHDKVNGAVRKSFLRVEPEQKIIRLELEIDTEAATLMEYFEIFITRMTLCRRAADFLGCKFRLSINGRDL